MKTDRICYEFNSKNYICVRNLLSNHLKERICNLMKLYNYKRIIILCIGTNKMKDDSFGPIVGSGLNKFKYYKNVEIIGTMQRTLNGTNIESFIKQNTSMINESLVIAIDASVSKSSIGSIIVSSKKLKPGAGVGKIFPEIGDIVIRGVTTNDLCIYDKEIIKNSDIEKFIKGNINIEKLNQMCNMTVDALFMTFGIKMSSDEIISKYIKQLELRRIELERIQETIMTTKEKRKLLHLHNKMLT